MVTFPAHVSEDDQCDSRRIGAGFFDFWLFLRPAQLGTRRSVCRLSPFPLAVAEGDKRRWQRPPFRRTMRRQTLASRKRRRRCSSTGERSTLSRRRLSSPRARSLTPFTTDPPLPPACPTMAICLLVRSRLVGFMIFVKDGSSWP